MIHRGGLPKKIIRNSCSAEPDLQKQLSIAKLGSVDSRSNAVSTKTNTIFSQKNQLSWLGLLLWRFGLLLASATGLYRMTKFLMRFVDLPAQLEIGIGLVVCGAFLFAVSLVMERIVDMRSEGDLGQ